MTKDQLAKLISNLWVGREKNEEKSPPLLQTYLPIDFYNPNTWFSGILLFFFLMATAFMGYVLPFGQMSFWGATVITNLLSPFPCLIEWVCGGHYVYNPTLKRFFLFHFQFPFFFCGFIILHLFYLHFHSSNNPLRLNTNNKIPFFPFIFLKDFIGFILILCLYLLQTHFGISSFSHPDNALEVCGLLTPLHIVPEWYFLCQYAMLKAVPNKKTNITRIQKEEIKRQKSGLLLPCDYSLDF